MVQQSEAELWRAISAGVKVKTVWVGAAEVETPSCRGVEAVFLEAVKPAEIMAAAAIAKIIRETAATVLDFIE
jgi:hypothetical protein